MLDPQILPYYNPETVRKTAIITCAHRGTGFYTALHLYLHGFIVYIATKDRKKGESAIKEIQKEGRRRFSPVVEGYLNKGAVNDDSNSETIGGSSFEIGANDRCLGELHYLKLDLFNLRSVESCVNRFKSQETKLDLLILNPELTNIAYIKTIDGFESQFQSNYIAMFLFSQSLLPVIPKNGRIIYVSSVVHHLELLPFNNNWDLDHEPNYIFTWLRYARARTCGIQYIKVLALKNPEINCYAVSPGLIMNKMLFWTRIPIIGIFLGIFIQIFRWLFCSTYEEGSFSTLYCALSSDSPLADNGSYFVPYGKLSQPSKVSQDLDNASQNWVWTIDNLRKRGYSDLD